MSEENERETYKAEGSENIAPLIDKERIERRMKLLSELRDFTEKVGIETSDDFEEFFSANLYFLGLGLLSAGGVMPTKEEIHFLVNSGYSDGIRMLRAEFEQSKKKKDTAFDPSVI